ncbi:hypothetical protein V6N13_046045 [Hibiscus sabdariffa]
MGRGAVAIPFSGSMLLFRFRLHFLSSTLDLAWSSESKVLDFVLVVSEWKRTGIPMWLLVELRGRIGLDLIIPLSE